jgi:hypothetical protein
MDLDFYGHMSWSFICSMSSGEVIVCFIDIGDIVDHHWLIYLFLRIN